MTIPFGVNLSFCVKRWVTPGLWAKLVREEIGVDLVQFSYDLIDPTWPDDLLSELAGELREATAAHSLTVHSAFVGLAHYTYNQLLHPDDRVRDVAEEWLGRAYRFAALPGIARVGGPSGLSPHGSMAGRRTKSRRLITATSSRACCGWPRSRIGTA